VLEVALPVSFVAFAERPRWIESRLYLAVRAVGLGMTSVVTVGKGEFGATVARSVSIGLSRPDDIRTWRFSIFFCANGLTICLGKDIGIPAAAE